MPRNYETHDHQANEAKEELDHRNTALKAAEDAIQSAALAKINAEKAVEWASHDFDSKTLLFNNCLVEGSDALVII